METTVVAIYIATISALDILHPYLAFKCGINVKVMLIVKFCRKIVYLGIEKKKKYTEEKKDITNI